MEVSKDTRSPYMLKAGDINKMFKSFGKEIKTQLENMRCEIVMALLKEDANLREFALGQEKEQGGKSNG